MKSTRKQRRTLRTAGFSLLPQMRERDRGKHHIQSKPVYQLPAQTHPQQNAMENDVVTHGLAGTGIMPRAPRYHTGSSRSLWLDLLLLLFPRSIPHLALSFPAPPLFKSFSAVRGGGGEADIELGFELGLISGTGLRMGLGMELGASLVAQTVKESTCNAGDLGSIPGSGRSSGEENGYPLQYSCLENPIDRGAWWATGHGVAKSQT